MTEIINAEAIQVAPANPAMPATRAIMNFDLSGFSATKAVFNAINAAGSLEEYRVETGLDEMTLKGLIVRPREVMDEATGEMIIEKGVTFMTESGDYFSKSAGIVSSAEALLDACGGHYPDDEIIRVKFFDVKLDAKRTLKKFSLV